MLLSSKHIFKERWESIIRYPITSILSLCIAILGVWENHITWNIELHKTLNFSIIALFFALPLSLVLPLMKQINIKISTITVIVGQWLSLLFWLVFYYFLPSSFSGINSSEQTWIIMSLAFVWVLPFLWIVIASKWDADTIRWWSQQYIIKFFVAWLACIIIWAGLAACFSSIEYLFNVNIDNRTYVDMLIVVWSILWVHIILMGIKDNLESRIYIKILRFFWLYIFLPLAGFYMLMLLVYILQIVISWNRPHGKITRMVIGYTVFGLLSYLLTYPLRSTHPFLLYIHRIYFVGCLIFMILLFMAISIRIREYGLTDERYIVCIIGLWILLMSTFSLYKSSRSLAAIIISFVWLMFFINYGPRSAHELPIKLQYAKLTWLLQTNGFLNNGIIQTKNTYIVPGQKLTGDIMKIHNLVSYLSTKRWINILKPLYGTGWFEQISWVRLRVSDLFIESLWVKYQFIDETNSEIENFIHSVNYFADKELKPIFLSGYSFLIPLNFNFLWDGRENISQLSQEVFIDYTSTDTWALKIIINSERYDIDFHSHIDAIDKESINNHKKLLWNNRDYSLIPIELTGTNYKFIVYEFEATENTKGEYTIYSYHGIILLK